MVADGEAGIRSIDLRDFAGQLMAKDQRLATTKSPVRPWRK